VKIHILFILILLSLHNCIAQNESNNWLFGINAWVNFSTGNPVPQAGSPMSVNEGCASFSDTSGNLLFFTDGVTVWNRNLAVMPNGTGLTGDPSSTQSAIIVPKAGSNYNNFYIFTVDDEAGINGLQYSEVDMSLNGGLGDITLLKNIPLITPTCEKVTAARDGSNPNEFWVITHEWNSARYFSFHVGSTGVNSSAVISNTGIVNLQGMGTQALQPSHGYMKASPDGSKLAIAIGNVVNAVQITDFNNVTGIVSNPYAMTGIRDPYGVEFSPNGRYLYVGKSSNPDTVFQYDLQAANISASRTVAGFTPPGMIITALQLAKNGKIYAGQLNQNFLSVINYPDSAGATCGFATNAVALPNACYQGLPNFFTSLFVSADYTYADTCLHDSTAFTLQYASIADSVRWDFDDPSTGSQNTSTIADPKHVFSASGNYTISCIVYDLGTSDTVLKTITIFSPLVYVSPGGSLCAGQPAWISNGNSAADSSHWFDNSTGDSILYIGPNSNTTNNIWVDVYQYGCVARDSVTIISFTYPVLDLGTDTTICATSYLLHADPLHQNSNSITYLWQNSSTADTFQVTAAGTAIYNVQASNNGCISYDTVSVTLTAPVTDSLGTDISFCSGDSAVLSELSGIAFTGYLWSTAATTSSITVNAAGTYWLQATINNCVARDSIVVTITAGPVANNVLGNDTSVCAASYLLNANPNNISGLTYVWQDGSSDSTFTVTVSNIYFVEVSNGSCTTYDTVNVVLGAPVTVDLGVDTNVCDNIPITLQDIHGTPFTAYAWSTGSTTAAINVSAGGTYTLTVTSNGCSDTDTVSVVSGITPSVNLGSDNSYCEGDIVQLDAGNPGATYLWQDGSTTQLITATSISGAYSVLVTQLGCAGSDTVNLTFNPSPLIFPVTDTTICRGTQVFLDITNIISGFTFQWSDNYPDPYRIIEDEGTYVATVSVGNCSRTSSFTLHLLDEPDIDLGEDTVACIGSIWTIDASFPQSTYLWQDGSTASTYVTNYPATFGVQVTNQCGVDVDSIKIDFTECNCFVVFPKAFTPNHDLKNDVFNFKYDCLAFKSVLKIYNRWGMLVFESDDPEEGWDGTYNSHEAAADIYVYMIEYKGVQDGKIQEKKERGTFLLYR
jgi:gliding motility-associated-like protein